MKQLSRSAKRFEEVGKKCELISALTHADNALRILPRKMHRMSLSSECEKSCKFVASPHTPPANNCHFYAIESGITTNVVCGEIH